MPTFHLRKQVLERLVKGASLAGELGLALLMTAGVSYCGGATEGTGGGGTSDAAPDHAGPWIEAAQGDAGVIEAAWDGSVVTEAAVFPDAGSDGSISPLPEACCVEAAWGPDGAPWIEAAYVDAGSGVADAAADASIADAGSDASIHPLPEAPR